MTLRTVPLGRDRTELDKLRAAVAGAAPAADVPVVDLRATMERLTAVMPLGDGVEHEETAVGGLPAEWTRSTAPLREVAAGGDAAILHFHGGGYVIGSPRTTRSVTAGMARHTGLPVVAPDYRLAPEHPFPAAVDDTVTAYTALLDRGFDPARVIVSGDSAGGGLTMALLLSLRDRGLPMPAGAVGISPLLDLTLSSPSIDVNAPKDPQVSRAFLEDVTVRNYLEAGTDPKSPLASPVFADLAGLPPVLLHVGGDESLLDDSVRFGEAAAAAGVDVTVEIWEAMIHVWHMFSPRLPEAEAAHAAIARWVGERLGGG